MFKVKNVTVVLIRILQEHLLIFNLILFFFPDVHLNFFLGSYKANSQISSKVFVNMPAD